MGKYIDRGILHFTYSVFILILIIVLASLITQDGNAEAPMGSFSDKPFNDEWKTYVNDEYLGTYSFPSVVDCNKNDSLIVSKELPEDLHDGMSLMLRTSLEDVRVFIDDELRAEYLAENLGIEMYYNPSEYVVVPLIKEDSGKECRLEYTIKEKGKLNTVSIGDGNNSWFPIIEKNLPLTVIALFVIIGGIVVIFFYGIFSRRVYVNNSVMFLGMLMMMLGIWIISESKLRQLILLRPSLSNIFSCLSMEMLGILVPLYFDAVQNRHHHKVYMTLSLVMCTQTLLNIILHVTSVFELHDTVTISHVWMAIGIVVVLINITRDILDKSVLSYRFVAIGMIIFLVFCIMEIIKYYVVKFSTFGIFLCIGLLILMFATIIQVIIDEADRIHLRESMQQRSWITTIETIASAIDAKDEYTGGHSNRVGEYAGILAKEMEQEYGFSEDDILRIRYIGLMHDIGKIGVADPILNKTGRLSDEEFTLMKKHVDIGYDLMGSMDANMDGLLDGIKYHHERFDGQGYPEGLKGAEIPLIARILCLADSYDAMTSNRVYRRRLSDKEVRDEILSCSGTQFDPALAEIFVRAIDKGNMKPVTDRGLETNVDGKILVSSLLEEKLQRDIKKEKIINPSHIRMACYIVKLSEQKNRKFDVLLLENINGGSVADISDACKPNLNVRDICIEYSDSILMLILFDRPDSETEKFKHSLPAEISIKVLKEKK